MNLFEKIYELTHFRAERKWRDATAVFTGRSKPEIQWKKLGTEKDNYTMYEIAYSVDGSLQHSWYSFYPLPDPDAEELAGKEIRIRYYIRKPYIFEYAGYETDVMAGGKVR